MCTHRVGPQGASPLRGRAGETVPGGGRGWGLRFLMFKSNWGRKPSHGSFSGFSLRGAPVSNDSPCQLTGLRTAAGQPPPHPHTQSAPSPPAPRCGCFQPVPVLPLTVWKSWRAGSLKTPPHFAFLWNAAPTLSSASLLFPLSGPWRDHVTSLFPAPLSPKHSRESHVKKTLYHLSF